MWRAMISARSRPRSTDLSWPGSRESSAHPGVVHIPGGGVRCVYTLAAGEVQLAPAHGAWVHVV